MPDLQGLIAAVTGAGGGIGSGIARALAQAGATVVVSDVDEEAARHTVDEVLRLPGRARLHTGDLTDPAAAAELVEETASQRGRLDVLVNSAGVLGRSTVAEMEDDEWRRVLAVNLDACFYTCRAAVPVMRDAGFGRIVNVASIAGIRVSYVGSAAYTASKAALIGFTRHLAVEVAPHGITANAVLPGVTATSMLDGADLDALSASIPAGRLGTPEDVASLVAFLASTEAGHITGAAIPVDGGISLLPGSYEAYRRSSGKE